MPVNPFKATTVPEQNAQVDGPLTHLIPLLAYLPDVNRDYQVGGCTIDRTTVPLENGLRLAYPGDVFRWDPGTGLWDLVSGTADDGTGPRYAMLLNLRDCTNANQSFHGLIRSQHVRKGLLKRTIPASLVGPNKAFEYHITSPVDVRS